MIPPQKSSSHGETHGSGPLPPPELWNSRLCSPHLQWPWMWGPLCPAPSSLFKPPTNHHSPLLWGFPPLFWSLSSLYQFSPPSHDSFSPFHCYFSTILPSYLTPNIPFQTSPQGVLSHWNSSAGKNDRAHKTQLNLCLGTSFRFPFPLPLFPAHCKLWGQRHDFPAYLLAHTARCCSAELWTSPVL